MNLNQIIREEINRQLKESVSDNAKTIAQFTGTRSDAVQKFIDDNQLDGSSLATWLKKGKYPERMSFVSALVGKPNNREQVSIIKKFKIK